jgi:hypothetical protein
MVYYDTSLTVGRDTSFECSFSVQEIDKVIAEEIPIGDLVEVPMPLLCLPDDKCLAGQLVKQGEMIHT